MRISQVPVFPVPGDLPDHRHIDREEGYVTVEFNSRLRALPQPHLSRPPAVGSLFTLPRRPGQEHVLLAQPALVAHFGERQRVAIAIEFVDSFSFA